MKSHTFTIIIILSIVLTACGVISTPDPITPLQETATATATATPTNVPPTATETSTPLPTLTPTPAAGTEMRIGPNEHAVVYVPAGEFLMGSDTGKANAAPAHTVYLDSFWIDKFEVTNLLYQRCMDAGGCTPPNKKALPASNAQKGDPNSRYDPPALLIAQKWDDQVNYKYPVINVTWEQAGEYCKWAGGRLPTEAEWEKAARGTDGFPFPWGEEEPYIVYRSLVDGSIIPESTPVVVVPKERSRRLQKDNSNAYAVFFQLNYLSEEPEEVGMYPDGASPYGALDMAGNVWEFVSDWYDKMFYANSPVENPTGPETGTFHIVRGGSWWSDNTTIHTYDRVNTTANGVGVLTVGFRCVFTP